MAPSNGITLEKLICVISKIVTFNKIGPCFPEPPKQSILGKLLDYIFKEEPIPKKPVSVVKALWNKLLVTIHVRNSLPPPVTKIAFKDIFYARATSKMATLVLGCLCTLILATISLVYIRYLLTTRAKRRLPTAHSQTESDVHAPKSLRGNNILEVHHIQRKHEKCGHAEEDDDVSKTDKDIWRLDDKLTKTRYKLDGSREIPENISRSKNFLSRQNKSSSCLTELFVQQRTSSAKERKSSGSKTVSKNGGKIGQQTRYMERENGEGDYSEPTTETNQKTKICKGYFKGVESTQCNVTLKYENATINTELSKNTTLYNRPVSSIYVRPGKLNQSQIPKTFSCKKGSALEDKNRSLAVQEMTNISCKLNSVGAQVVYGVAKVDAGTTISHNSYKTKVDAGTTISHNSYKAKVDAGTTISHNSYKTGCRCGSKARSTTSTVNVDNLLKWRNYYEKELALADHPRMSSMDVGRLQLEYIRSIVHILRRGQNRESERRRPPRNIVHNRDGCCEDHKYSNKTSGVSSIKDNALSNTSVNLATSRDGRQPTPIVTKMEDCEFIHVTTGVSVKDESGTCLGENPIDTLSAASSTTWPSSDILVTPSTLVQPCCNGSINSDELTRIVDESLLSFEENERRIERELVENRSKYTWSDFNKDLIKSGNTKIDLPEQAAEVHAARASPRASPSQIPKRGFKYASTVSPLKKPLNRQGSLLPQYEGCRSAVLISKTK